jgi:hypothetical protein
MNKRGTELSLLILNYMVENEETDIIGYINGDLMWESIKDKTSESETACSELLEDLINLTFVEVSNDTTFLRITNAGKEFLKTKKEN